MCFRRTIIARRTVCFRSERLTSQTCNYGHACAVCENSISRLTVDGFDLCFRRDYRLENAKKNTRKKTTEQLAQLHTVFRSIIKLLCSTAISACARCTTLCTRSGFKCTAWRRRRRRTITSCACLRFEKKTLRWHDDTQTLMFFSVFLNLFFLCLFAVLSRQWRY